MKGKVKIGRPSDYGEDKLEKARDYLRNYESKYGRALPSLVGLARAIGVSRETVYAWRDDDDKAEFSDITEQILQEQHEVALTKGLLGEYNATLVKLLLGKHGYNERSANPGPLTPISRVILVPATSEDRPGE